MPQPLLILGAGTFALETLDIAETAGDFEPLGFVVSLESSTPKNQLAGLPIYHATNLPIQPEECWLVTGIVSNQRRGFIETMLKQGYRFTSVIHPSAIISRRSTIGPGCVINPGVVIASNTIISPHVIVNRGSLIGHDNQIRSFATIGPGANLAGGITVEAGAYIGVGAFIRDHLSIGADSVVAAGAVVVKSVPEATLVAGVPATTMKTGVKGL